MLLRSGTVKRMIFINYSVVIIALLLFACDRRDIIIEVINLKCENRINPIGIDESNLKLSWNLYSSLRNKKQSAYRILVSDTKEKIDQSIGNIWDSKKIFSDRNIRIKYLGKPLSSEMIYYWKVRVWDEQGDSSAWSKTASWEMGLISNTDWKAKWINDGKIGPQKLEEFYLNDPAPLFRREFDIKKKISRARLYISGLGYYEANINGNKISKYLLDPGWTNYSKRVLYSTYDVSTLIREGGNAIGVMLGNGWYNPLPMTMWGYLNLREHLPIGRPRFIAQLKIDYSDGSSEQIISDESWKTHEGPILRNNIYLGEIYDARLEIENWDKYGFGDTSWNKAILAKEKVGILQAQRQPQIEITKIIEPKKITVPKSNIYVFDMGQNFAGLVRLKVESKPGKEIMLRYGELLNEDGTLNVMTSVAGQIKGKNDEGRLRGGLYSPDTAWQSDIYITKGKGVECYTPRFTFHSFRYVEIIGYPGKPSLDALVGYRINSKLDTTGSFECSNDLFNEIQKITEWTFLSNIFSVQSDCPHRERFGYGGDIAVTTDAFIYNYDMNEFYSKAARDFQDAAHPNGMLTDTAPFVGIDYCGIGWALVHPLIISELYQYYGNRDVVEEQYETARKWFELVISENELIVENGLSDHESLEPTPTSQLVTPLFYQSATIMRKLAEIINNEEDVEKYKNLSQRIKNEYLERFLEKGKGKISPNTQGSQSFALYTGIMPEDEIENAVIALKQNIIENDGHLRTGIFGTKFLLDVLSKYGYAETAGQIVSQTSFPGWGFMLANGATTLWEHWDFSDNTYSHNHPMFGSVSEWFYKWVAGIQIDSSAIGFDKIIIRPQVLSNVDWVKAHYNSSQGRIVSHWQQDEETLILSVTIPMNATATVYLPFDDITKIYEGGNNIQEVEDIRFVKLEAGNAIYKIGSGNYLFESQIR